MASEPHVAALRPGEWTKRRLSLHSDVAASLDVSGAVQSINIQETT
jgi:hypothetical protein